MAYYPQAWDDGIIEPWKAYFAKTEWVNIDEAAGREAASTIRQYPPGIPEIIPSMTYTKTIIDRLDEAFKAHSNVVGVDLSYERLVEVLCRPARLSKLEQYDFVTMQSDKISEALAFEVADFFGAGFSAWPYYHFALHESDPLTSLPPSLGFEKWARVIRIETWVKNTKSGNGLETWSARVDALKDELMTQAHKTAKNWYDIDELSAIALPEGFHRWTDPQICRDQIWDRLSDPGYVTLVRDKFTGQLRGLLHSRMGTVERLFYSEEWANPCLFSHYENAELLDSSERFYRKIRFHFGMIPEDECMTISAQILHPSAYGGEIFYAMMRSMALEVSPSHAVKPLICEIPPTGTAHTLNVASSRKIVFDVIKNEHPLVYCKKTSDALFPFIADKAHWIHALRSEMQDQKDLKNWHYVRSIKDHSNIDVRPNGDMGLAAFATAPIQAGERIAVFEGETYEADDALTLAPIMRDHAIQVGPKTYVFGYRGLAHCLCHSCEPNCGIRNYTEIFAARNIASGEQLTWDYRCSENSTWKLDTCLCGSKRCTSVIANYDSLPAEMRKEYLSKGMVSEWLDK